VVLVLARLVLVQHNLEQLVLTPLVFQLQLLGAVEVQEQILVRLLLVEDLVGVDLIVDQVHRLLHQTMGAHPIMEMMEEMDFNPTQTMLVVEEVVLVRLVATLQRVVAEMVAMVVLDELIQLQVVV
jgi:hypothetical protein